MAGDAVYSAVQDFLTVEANIESLRNGDTGQLPTFRWDNDDDFTKPDPLNGEWIAVSMTGMLYGQESIGASRQADNRWDDGGKFWFSVFVASGSGAKRSLQIAYGLARIFRGLMLLSDSLEFGDAVISQGGPADPEDGNWHERPVGISWRQMDA